MSDPWAGILDEGERILWQGRPDTGLTLGPHNILTALFGLFFAGFALVWMVMAMRAGDGFWMFGLLHFSVGAALVFGALFWGPFRRRRSWYTLTDHRAFIATDLPLQGKSLRSWAIGPDTVLELVDGPLQTVNFATEIRRSGSGTRRKTHGFERITEGREVYRLMLDIQTRAGRKGQTA